MGGRTISVCDAGDAVCDYDPDADEVSPTSVPVHTSYALVDAADSWDMEGARAPRVVADLRFLRLPPRHLTFPRSSPPVRKTGLFAAVGR